MGKFDDINELTIFADYRVPQVLNFFGTVKYGCDLQSKLESDFVFQYGDEEEVEIRAASVLVVDVSLSALLFLENSANRQHWIRARGLYL